jgi:hypothetical protein
MFEIVITCQLVEALTDLWLDDQEKDETVQDGSSLPYLNWNVHLKSTYFFMEKMEDAIPFINAQKNLELLNWPQRPLLGGLFLHNLFIWKAWEKHNLRSVASWFWGFHNKKDWR